MVDEIWIDINGYEGLYLISNYGRVKSLNYLHHGIVKILKQGIRNGYSYVTLQKNGNIKKEYVHRLVASAFIKNPLNYPEVNHKDEVKTHNCVENLEWCDKKYNCNYGTRNDRISKTRKRSTNENIN
jgi:hypothetical protein